MAVFEGFHSEWNLGSPGGWDYQRTAQEISKVIWNRLNQMASMGIELDFDHPQFHPVVGFSQLLLNAHKQREGSNPGTIAVVAEEETLKDVTENINLAKRLDSVDGITGILAAPHEFELVNERTCYRGNPVSIIFMDFNNDVLLKLHRKHNLSPILKAVRDHRVINPRGTEPINVKSMFEVLTGPMSDKFQRESTLRTPWTRRFFHRKTNGPNGEEIKDLVEWTRSRWDKLVLKPERGYSGIGVRVGGINNDGDEAIELALGGGHYIVQEKVPLELWAEKLPELDEGSGSINLTNRQTDFRCFIGPNVVFGFLCRFGDVPTNVGSGGGIQSMGLLKTGISVGQAVDRINKKILNLKYNHLKELEDLQRSMALDEKFTYLLGPIKIPLRPRVITTPQLADLEKYCAAMWSDCIKLEKMWQEGRLNEFIDIEEEELEIARMQPWGGSPAVFAADGLFNFGAHLEVV